MYLNQVRCREILQDLYGNVITPAAVAAELETGSELGFDVPDLFWLLIKKPSLCRRDACMPSKTSEQRGQLVAR